MTDVVEVVRSAGSVSRNPWSDTGEGRATRERAFSTDPTTVPRDRLPKWPALVAAALAFVVVAGVAMLTTGRSDEAPRPIGAPTLHQLTHGTWEVLPSRLIMDLQDPTTVWSGHELLVWSTSADRGAAFDPHTRRWTAIPPSGVIDGQQPVWVDGRMVVWAGATPPEFGPPPGPGAGYDPMLHRWSVIAPPPVRPNPNGTTSAVAAGDALVVIGAEIVCPANADCDTSYLASAEYVPSMDAWHALPAWPERSMPPHFAAWDGQRVVVLAPGTAWALDVDRGAWTQLANPPYQLGLAFAVNRTGGQLWIGFQTQGPAIHDNRVPWRALVLGPGASGWSSFPKTFDGRSISPFAAVRVGRNVAVLGWDAPFPSAVFDPATGEWHRMPAPKRVVGLRDNGAYWTGREIVGLDASGQLAAYTPGRR